MEKLIGWLRDKTGIRQEMEINAFSIARVHDRTLCIDVTMRYWPPEERKPEVAPIATGSAEILVINKKEVPSMKRKYSRRKKAEVIVQKPVLKKDLLSPGRVFSTSDEDIKIAKAFLCNWTRESGMLNEEQKRALQSTAGIFAKSMSEPMKVQIISIFNDVRRKKGLIK